MFKENKVKLASVLVGIFVLLNLIPAYAAPVNNAITYLDSIQDSDGGFGDFGTSCWVANAYKAYGEVPVTLSNYLRSNHQAQVEMGDASQVSRFILAAVACGWNPRDIDGVDYVQALQALHNGEGSYGDPTFLFDDFWPLIALSASNVNGDVTFIKQNQNPDGGWGWGIGQPSDCDDTAAAIMALRGHGTPTSDASIISALAYLSAQQMPDGGFPGWGPSNADTDSWSICAIRSCGQDPATWGYNPVAHLESLQQPDGSIYWQLGDPGFNLKLTTAYGIIALRNSFFPVARYSPPVQRDPSNKRPACRRNVSNIKPSVGDKVSFIDRSRDRDGEVKSCSWYFMGPVDIEFQGFNVSVVFEEPGYYLVRHRVFDNDGKRRQKFFWVYVEPDINPPETQAYLLRGEGFVAVYFDAVDEGIGVKTTYWKVNGLLGEGPLIIKEKGSYEVEYWSVDNSGNVEDPRTTYVTVEGTSLPEPL